MNNIIWLDKVSAHDIEKVGGKNASLGEMIQHLTHQKIKVPFGFATTAEAFNYFLENNQLYEKIHNLLDKTDIDHPNKLAASGQTIRQWILEAPFQKEFNDDIKQAYADLSKNSKAKSMAVRSSATAEDLPEASFAGQQETYLNISGIDHILLAIKKVFASLFNDRAISYRVHQNFAHREVAISACIQEMVRSDIGSSGVMFTLDTESGFKDVVLITASYGLGESIVQGAVNPDEFYVYKPALANHKKAIINKTMGSKLIQMVYSKNSEDTEESITTLPVEPQLQRQFSITDEDIQQLAHYAIAIEKHYQQPMDIEWGKDGENNQIYILQARPETVKSNTSNIIENFQLQQQSQILCQGRSVGQRIGTGRARILQSIADMNKVQKGDVLVTDMTDPDWEPIMKKAAAIVTNRGGRTCHAAIIARELGIPAVVGCGDATTKIRDTQDITVSCAEGDIGNIYQDKLKFIIETIALDKMPDIPIKIMLNVANPERAFRFAQIPNHGVGLARLEFIINQTIGIHPKALLHFDTLDDTTQQAITEKMLGYSDPIEFYIDNLSRGIAMIAAAFYPKPVIVRCSDFKSNEYANLLGGQHFEPHEENPMIGFRGASRYIAEDFRDCFDLECKALNTVIHAMGFDNLEIMIPFVRTVNEAKEVIEILAENQIKRSPQQRLIMMCELPSNALLATEFLAYFDGFSIGSNDLTQLTLGLDRDSAKISHLFDERNLAIKKLIKLAIEACHEEKKYIGICGQGPSDFPDFAQWLVGQKITSLSLNPDSVVATWMAISRSQS